MKQSRISKCGLLVLLAGCIFLGLGIWRKEPDTVARKSNMICMECVGIG